MPHGQEWVQLAQVRPADTANTTLFTPVRGFQYQCKVLAINVDGGNRTYRLFHDYDGTTFDESTALAWDRAVAAGEIDEIPETGHIYVDGDEGGAIAVRASTGNSMTFTLYAIREKKS